MLHPLVRPRALFGHAVVLTVVATCLVLGQWQLDRLAQVRESNARAAAQLTAPTLDLDELLEAGKDPGALASLEYRRFVVEGTFRPDEEVLQRNQQLRGQTGFHVLTPLALPDDLAILVLRGWVPASHDEPPVAAAAPPEGPVEVSGVLVRSVDQPGFGARDPEDGVLRRVFHADVGRLDAQVAGRLLPMVLRVDRAPEAVAFDELPVPVGPPLLEEGNHLSYAVQWHIFAALAAGTYVVWLWAQRRRAPST